MKQLLQSAIMAGIFVVPVLTLYISNSLFFPYITGKNFAFRIIVELIFAAWVLLAFYDAEYRPRFSWALVSFTTLTGVMLAASLLAYHPHTALWSNYERMGGFVMLVHAWGYLVVVGSMLKTPKQWTWFLHTSLAAAILVTLYGLRQLSNNPSYRIDSTLGNSTYMAIYMLFHIAIVALLSLRTKSNLYRGIYLMLGIIFALVLIQTGTRGTAIGLAGGLVTTVGYMALFGVRYPHIRKYAIAGFVVLVVMTGAFVAARDSAVIQENKTFARIANINLTKDLEIRRIIWGEAWEGVKERPVLGWGNGNFNYIFNAKYDPRLYDQEQWFDRVHNLVLDWLVYGGVLGFMAYVSIFVALLFYLVYRPWRYDDHVFSVPEQAVLAGLLVGYTLHNLVVFDNLVSYIFFVLIIALIHSRVAKPIPMFMQKKFDSSVVTNIVAPVVAVAAVGTVYYVNIPAYAAAHDIILAMKSKDISERYDIFNRALKSRTFAHQEVVEQFTQQAITVSQSKDVSATIKEKYDARAEAELADMMVRKPNDARLYVFQASYYRAIGQYEKAATALASARELSPNKQSIILQQGANALALNDDGAALGFFKEAFELDERFNTAREYYTTMLFKTGDREAAIATMRAGDEEFNDEFAKSSFATSILNQLKDYEIMVELFERRVKMESDSAQVWASLAFVYNESGQLDKAVEILERASEAIPSFAPTAQCISDNLENGREPQEGCK